MAQLSVAELGDVNAAQLPAAQILREFPGIESIGLHSLSRGSGHHCGRHYQTRIAAGDQLIVQALNEGHALRREMLPHALEQLGGTIRQPK